MNQNVITHIDLIRHGETDWNASHRYQGREDIPLNVAGREQAQMLAESMRGEQWDLIVSSPSVRALDTAKTVASAVGIPEDEIILQPALMERSYGVAEGMTLQEREAQWPGGEWPGLEDWEDVANRAMRTLRDLARDYPGKRILVVCHGGVINSILATISDGEIGTGKTVITNTSRTSIEIGPEEWTIGEVNDIAHLGEMAIAN